MRRIESFSPEGLTRSPHPVDAQQPRAEPLSPGSKRVLEEFEPSSPPTIVFYSTYSQPRPSLPLPLETWGNRHRRLKTQENMEINYLGWIEKGRSSTKTRHPSISRISCSLMPSSIREGIPANKRSGTQIIHPGAQESTRLEESHTATVVPDPPRLLVKHHSRVSTPYIKLSSIIFGDDRMLAKFSSNFPSAVYTSEIPKTHPRAPTVIVQQDLTRPGSNIQRNKVNDRRGKLMNEKADLGFTSGNGYAREFPAWSSDSARSPIEVRNTGNQFPTEKQQSNPKSSTLIKIKIGGQPGTKMKEDSKTQAPSKALTSTQQAFKSIDSTLRQDSNSQ